MTKTKIDYYGDKDNYIHLKWGDCVKMFNFTDELIAQYPLFTTEYLKYYTGDTTCQFKNPFQIVRYVYKNNIPVHFYFNFTDEPAFNEGEVMEYLMDNIHIELK